MAVIDRIDTLARIREKVEANERLEAGEREALRTCDDLLALGELADAARRARGGSDDVSFALGGEASLAETAATAAEQLKALALERLLGDGDRVSADATALGLPLAGVALHFGADDLHAGAGADRDEIVRTITAAGRVPVERAW